jgi:hypothetical protein
VRGPRRAQCVKGGQIAFLDTNRWDDVLPISLRRLSRTLRLRESDALLERSAKIAASSAELLRSLDLHPMRLVRLHRGHGDLRSGGGDLSSCNAHLSSCNAHLSSHNARPSLRNERPAEGQGDPARGDVLLPARAPLRSSGSGAFLSGSLVCVEESGLLSRGSERLTAMPSAAPSGKRGLRRERSTCLSTDHAWHREGWAWRVAG